MLADYDANAIAEVMGIPLRPEAELRPVAPELRVPAQFAETQALAPLPPSPRLIERAVEHGLPRHALRHVAEHLAGGDKAKVAALEWAVVPKTTLERRHTHLSPQESERTERLARLFVQASRALGTAAEAREFMTTAHPLLDGRSPFEATKTDLGTRRTEHILHGLEYGLAL